MEEATEEAKPVNKKPHTNVGVPYPIVTVEEMLEAAQQLVSEYGSSRPITKAEICTTLGKKENTLTLFFSSMQQYGIFTLIHGKGYQPSDLYRKFTEPVHDGDEYKYKLQMFKTAPLYSKITENLNGHQLPADEKRVANLLKGDPYNVNINSADRAAKVFLENCRNLNLRDHSGKFKFPDLSARVSNPEVNKGAPADETPPKPPRQPEDGLFELPIPLDSKRKAYIRYPLNDLSKKDIRVIVKALSFIASSIETDNDDDDFEIKIIETKKNRTDQNQP